VTPELTPPTHEWLRGEMRSDKFIVMTAAPALAKIPKGRIELQLDPK
jgi:hypothetical protein